MNISLLSMQNTYACKTFSSTNKQKISFNGQTGSVDTFTSTEPPHICKIVKVDSTNYTITYVNKDGKKQ